MTDESLTKRVIHRYVMILRQPVFRWFMLAYFVIVFGFLSFRILPQLHRGDTLGDQSTALLIDLRSKFNSLESRNLQLAKQLAEHQNLIKGQEALSEPAATAGRITTLSANVTLIDRDLKALKRALNPTLPEEILTVARLGDKFELLELQLAAASTKITSLETSVDVKIQRGYDQLNAQIDRIVDMIKWVGLLLLPIIFNTIRDLVKGS